MVQARGGVQITLREIPNYGVVVVAPLDFLPVEAGIEPLLLSINGQSVHDKTLSQLRAMLSGQPGTPITLDILSADLNFHRLVTLLRTPCFASIEPSMTAQLDKCFELLDTVDSGDWPGLLLEAAQTTSTPIFEPVSSTVFKTALKLSDGWLTPRSMVHLWAHIAAAIHFDKICETENATLAINKALSFLPDFDCLNFEEAVHLVEFLDHLIITQRITQARSFAHKLLDAARNSLNSDFKTTEILQRILKFDSEPDATKLEELFERSSRAMLPEKLEYVGHLFVKIGDFRKASKALTSATYARLVPGSSSKCLQNYVQPGAYAKWLEALADEKDGHIDSARTALKDAIDIFQKEFSIEQLALIDQLPSLFPRPKDLMAKLAEVKVNLPMPQDGHQIPFYMRARKLMDQPRTDNTNIINEVVSELLADAELEEDPVQARSLVWNSLLSIARQDIQENNFDSAFELLQQVSQQSQGLPQAPLYLPGSYTLLAAFADEFKIDPIQQWQCLEEILLNYLKPGYSHHSELSSLPTALSAASIASVSDCAIRAKALRYWSLSYLRNEDFAIAEKILLRSRDYADKASISANSRGLLELLSLVHGDLAVAQIGLNQISESEQSAAKMLACKTPAPGKVYQVAEAYKKKNLIENAESLLTESLNDSTLKILKNVAFKRMNFSEGGFHMWKLANLADHHLQFLAEATNQFSNTNLPPQLGYFAGTYAQSRRDFYQAARQFRRAANATQGFLSEVSVAQLKQQLLLLALGNAELVKDFSSDELIGIVLELASVAKLTNKELSIICHRRAIASQGLSVTLTENLQKALSEMVANSSDDEQLASEIRLASLKDRNHQVRTEKYWLEKAATELHENRHEAGVKYIAHAIELFRLSLPISSNFRAPLITHYDSAVTELCAAGLSADAESFLLQIATISGEKYGVGSEEESRCLVELAVLFYNLREFEKCKALTTELTKSYLSYKLATDTSIEQVASPLVNRLHQLAVIMAATEHLDLALELLEEIVLIEKQALPAQHIDLISTLLLQGRLRAQNNQLEMSEVVFEHVFESVSMDKLFSILNDYVGDYCEVLRKNGKKAAAKKVALRFSKALELVRKSRIPAPPMVRHEREFEQESRAWEELGKTNQAKTRYIKAVERVFHEYPPDALTTEALEHLASYQFDNNCLGQAAETFLTLIKKYDEDVKDQSSRKVPALLFLARCYTRLCMYEEVPDLVIEAKQIDPEIRGGFQTIDTTLFYAEVEFEAHLLNEAREDAAQAESLTDSRLSLDVSMRRDYYRRIFHLWSGLGEDAKADATREKLEILPVDERQAKNSESQKWGVAETHSEQTKTVSEACDSPRPFTFLERLEFEAAQLASAADLRCEQTYLENIAKKISENWFPPVEKQATLIQTQFVITTDGICSNVQQLRPSTNKYANAAVEEAILGAAPFDALPEELGEQALFQLTFNNAEYAANKSGITFEAVE